MIVDLPRFAAAERGYWNELESVLDKIQAERGWQMTIPEVQRLHYLYERCSADLARLDSFSTEPRLLEYVEALVARAYAEIHETRARREKIRWRALFAAFPRAFRRHLREFGLAVGLTLLGCGFGWFAIRTAPDAKSVLMPFQGLMDSPKQRVAREERAGADRLSGHKATFSAQLMTHNIQVTFLTMAAGITWGAGTVILLFYNGVILGAVAADYAGAGYTQFLAGWLLPHGAVEIPAILLGGQAGFILAGALIGWGKRKTRSERLREASHDLLTIAGGAACLLVWAGIVEAFVSQYHQPVLPYALKIGFGLIESAALWLYLGRTGRS
ncbi:MAG: stage II sporulation protein M [Bryobacteraceae bacterium]